METRITTGHTRENRVTILDERDRNNAIFGSTTFETNGAGGEISRLWPATFISDIGGQMAATVTGPNTVKIADGVGFMEGVQWTVEELGQEFAFPGYDPVDGHQRFLILAKYTRDSATGIEDVDLVVHKGGDDSVPYDGTIASGAAFFYQPLYNVVIGRNGIVSLTSGYWPDDIAGYLDSPVALGAHARPYMSQGERRREEVKRLYEANADTNAFTDAEKTKLAELVLCPYRVGDILETENPEHPGMSWPGTTWEDYAPGRVLIGKGSNGQTSYASVGVDVGGDTHDHGDAHTHGSAAHTHPGSGTHKHGLAAGRADIMVGSTQLVMRRIAGSLAATWIKSISGGVAGDSYTGGTGVGLSGTTDAANNPATGSAVVTTNSQSVVRTGAAGSVQASRVVYRWKRTS